MSFYETWYRKTKDSKWEKISLGSLEKSVDKNIELMYPGTEKTVGFFKVEGQRTGETPRQVIKRIDETIASGEIGTPGSFDLS